MIAPAAKQPDAPAVSAPPKTASAVTQPAGNSSAPTTLSQEQLLQAYQDMLLLRRFEERAAALYQQGHMGGFLHLYIGQEAVIVGSKLASAPHDDFITSYRCHAHAIMCGIPPEAVMAELCQRATGISKGKGGSMHMFDPSKHFWGGHGIVAAQVPLGAGIAFARKYKNEPGVCLNYLGDGAANAGQFFETLNMAALWELPVLFIIENNQYSMGTAVHRGSAGEFYTRGECFGIPGQKVDGQDVCAVHAAVAASLQRIRQTQKPELIEMDTYRYRGHSMSDPGKYRSRVEIEEMRESRDPITKLHLRLLEDFGVSAEALKAYDTAAKERVQDIADAALNAPWPSEDELLTDVLPA